MERIIRNGGVLVSVQLVAQRVQDCRFSGTFACSKNGNAFGQLELLSLGERARFRNIGREETEHVDGCVGMAGPKYTESESAGERGVYRNGESGVERGTRTKIDTKTGFSAHPVTDSGAQGAVREITR